MKRRAYLAPYVVLLGLLLGDLAAAQEATTLRAGEVHDRTVAAGEKHTYGLTLEEGWVVAARAELHGDPVVFTVLGPDEQEITRFESPADRSGPRPFKFESESAGLHRLEVEPGGEGGPARYTLRVTRVEAEASTPEGRVEQALWVFDEDTPGGVVAIIRNGQVDLAQSRGAADLTYDVPFSENTVTNIGSTSKQFTGFAIALLDERGLLSLDDDVRTHIPELPDFGETITLRNLLTHTSGYREFINTLALGGRQVLGGDEVRREEVIGIVQRQPELQNSPGAEFNYNNTAFSLLTQVVERVDGRDFPTFMEEEVFRPLGMTNTVVKSHPGQIIPNSSTGYAVADHGFREVRDLGASMGAGGIYTTVGDLARWMGNLRSGAHGGEAVRDALTTKFVLTDGDTTSYGLGLFIDEERGLRRIHHGGADVAHRSSFVYYPDLDAGYVVLSNHAALPGTVEREVVEAVFGPHMTPRETRASADESAAPELVNAELAAAYVGRYELEIAPGTMIDISLDDEQRLMLQVTGQPAAALVPTSDSTYTIPGVEASVTFHRDAEGEVNEMTLHQNGDHIARRVEEAGPPVDVAPLAGRYFSEELQTFYELTVEDGTLRIEHRRFDPVTLTHSKGDTFTGTFPVGELTFERDESGEVTGFLVGNGRARDIQFVREVR